MPELPEVETVLNGLRPHLTGAQLLGAEVRQSRLRWPVPEALDHTLRGRRIVALSRRGKYLLLELDRAALILHLGMSGSLHLLTRDEAAGPHDHLDLLLDGPRRLRLRDPRRFGAVLLTEDPLSHPLLAALGVEPLGEAFTGEYLYARSRGRSLAIKQLLMDAHLITGIGNIYANESLFYAGIDPRTPAMRLSRRRADKLVEAVRTTLTRAIAAGGSSLRDFVDSSGRPGYFQQDCAVYGRTGLPCRQCGTPIVGLRQAGRASFLCPRCQKR